MMKDKQCMVVIDESHFPACMVSDCWHVTAHQSDLLSVVSNATADITSREYPIHLKYQV